MLCRAAAVTCLRWGSLRFYTAFQYARFALPAPAIPVWIFFASPAPLSTKKDDSRLAGSSRLPSGDLASGAPRPSGCLPARSSPRPSFSRACAEHGDMFGSPNGCSSTKICGAGARTCRALRWPRCGQEGDFALPAARMRPAFFPGFTSALPVLAGPQRRIYASGARADTVASSGRCCQQSQHVDRSMPCLRARSPGRPQPSAACASGRARASRCGFRAAGERPERAAVGSIQASYWKKEKISV